MLHYAAADLKEAEGSQAEAEAVYGALAAQLLPEATDPAGAPAPAQVRLCCSLLVTIAGPECSMQAVHDCPHEASADRSAARNVRLVLGTQAMLLGMTPHSSATTIANKTWCMRCRAPLPDSKHVI